MGFFSSFMGIFKGLQSRIPIKITSSNFIIKKTILKNQDREIVISLAKNKNGDYYSVITLFQNDWSNDYRLNKEEMKLFVENMQSVIDYIDSLDRDEGGVM
ncbi:hypothetical protein [Rhizobium sp. FY34]|uniref:hypothetical protein n=1 Tax=Rhizobium sp. FY34 TaxID=2562309 RepID=UPI0010BF9918|nr:hypothetical protein [Rhizobium sp. FY34]